MEKPIIFGQKKTHTQTTLLTQNEMTNILDSSVSNYILSNQISDDPDSKTSNSQRTTSEYRLQREFDSKEAFCEWWKNGGLLGWYRNDAYTRKTGEEVQTFRCAQRLCKHIMRVIFPIKPNSPVRLETTIVNGRHQDQHQEKKIKLLNSVTKERITQLNAEGYRVKEIHAILLKEFGKDKSPTRLQIRNYISRNRIAKLNGSETNTQVKSHDDVQTEINGESNDPIDYEYLMQQIVKSVEDGQFKEIRDNPPVNEIEVKQSNPTELPNKSDPIQSTMPDSEEAHFSSFIAKRLQTFETRKRRIIEHKIHSLLLRAELDDNFFDYQPGNRDWMI